MLAVLALPYIRLGDKILWHAIVFFLKFLTLIHSSLNLPEISLQEHPSGEIFALGYVPLVQTSWIIPISIRATSFTSFVSSNNLPRISTKITLLGRVGDGNVTFSDPRAIRNMESRFFRQPKRLNLAIGPSSELVRQFESVGISRGNRRAIMMLNRTQAEFENQCVANSVMRIPVFVDPWGLRSTLTVGFELSDATIILDPVTVSLSYLTHIMIVPAPIVYGILAKLLERGAVTRVTSEKKWIFANCAPETVQDLPSVHLSFFGYTNEIGHVELHPTDYIRLDIPSGECDLQLRAASVYGPSMVQLNPLRIPGVNLRITESVIELCDSLGPYAD